MWRLLPNALYNKADLYFSPRRRFLLQIIGFVFSVHMVFALIAFVMGWWYNGKNNFTVSLHEQTATYVLMPFHKTVEIKKNKQISSVQCNKKSNIINYDAYVNKKNALKKNSPIRLKTQKNQVNQKAILSKSVQTTKQASKHKTSNPSIASMILQTSKTEKLPKGKKKKISKVKMQSLPAQDVFGQTVSEPIMQDSIIVEQVNVQQITVEQVKPEQNELDRIDDAQEDDDIDLDNVVFVGNQDLDERLLGQKVQQLVVQHWAPPAGMASGQSCKIRVRVDQDGQGVDAQVVKGSGVFMYDRSLRMATLVEGYPKELCGKTISFTFEE